MPGHPQSVQHSQFGETSPGFSPNMTTTSPSLGQAQYLWTQFAQHPALPYYGQHGNPRYSQYQPPPEPSSLSMVPTLPSWPSSSSAHATRLCWKHSARGCTLTRKLGIERLRSPRPSPEAKTVRLRPVGWQSPLGRACRRPQRPFCSRS